MRKINERAISLDILMKARESKQFNHIALKQELDKHEDLEQRQKAFITELTNGVLRNQLYIDYILSCYSKTPLKKMKPVILNILRQGIYQLLEMDKVGQHALVNESVNLAKLKGYQGLAPFVNGVLRTIVRERDTLTLPQQNTPEFLSVRYSYPQWMVDMYLKRYEYGFVEGMFAENNRQPMVSVCVNTLKTTKIELMKQLSKTMEVQDNTLFKNGFYIRGSSNLAENECFTQGLFHIQDLSSQLAVEVLSPQQGDFVIDACAAPGGKAFYAAAMMGNIGNYIARDIVRQKLEKLKKETKRLGISIIETQNYDATIADEALYEKADKVLLDAPCSGFGLVRKKPDIKLNKTKQDIQALSKLQRNILTICSRYVKKGGILVYSTCTNTEEENEGNVQWFLENHPFYAEDVTPFLPERLEFPTAKQGYVNLYPHIHHTDGFFISRFRRG